MQRDNILHDTITLCWVVQKRSWGKQPFQNLVRELERARELDQHTRELGTCMSILLLNPVWRLSPTTRCCKTKRQLYAKWEVENTRDIWVERFMRLVWKISGVATGNGRPSWNWGVPHHVWLGENRRLVTYRTSWAWETTSRSSRLHEDYRSSCRNL